MLEYKGYSGHVEYDCETRLLHGEVLDLRDVITFQGETGEEIEKAFRDSIDDYLEFCKQRNETPDRPFSGRFMLRLSASAHRKAYIRAKMEGKSLNQWISEKVTRAI